MGTIFQCLTWTFLLLSLQIDAVRLESTTCGNQPQITKVKKSHLPLSDHPLLPFYVSLMMTDKIDPICSGTIISEEFVLTAGRCVNQLNQKTKMRAVIGFTYSNAGDKNDRFDIKDVELSKDGQLALLKLSNKIVFSEKVSNICLPTDADNISNSSMVVPFWKLNNGLSSLEYTSIIPSSCPKVPDDKLCFKIAEQSRCLLDDGAPLISHSKRQVTLTGILEIGNICRAPKIGSAINVQKYLSWIKDKTKISGCKKHVGFHIKSVMLTSNIINRFAQTKAEVTVVNFSPVAQEISYDFYHPDSAVVTNLEITIDSHTLKGYTTKAATARQVYNQSNRTAVLLEMSRTNDHVVTLRANVSAFQAVNFSMTYQDFLIRESNTVKMLFGLTVDNKIENVKAEISVSEIGPFNDFVVNDMVQKIEKSAIKVQKEKNGRCLPREICRKVITFDVPIRRESNLTNPEEDGLHQIKHFSFEYKPGNVFTGEIIEDGYFAYFLPSNYFPLSRKLVIFILDISGSMSGIKVSQMKNAMITMLDSLRKEDLFQIITFNHWCQPMNSQPLKSNEKNIRNATNFVMKIKPTGATNAYCALEMGLKNVISEKTKHNTLQPIIYFLSDGMPNVEMEKKSTVERLLISVQAPVHGIAFGRDADFPFVKNISNLSNGKSVKLEENANVYLKLEQFFFDLTSPSRDEIQIEMNCAGFQSNVTSNRWGKMLFTESDRVIVGKQADKPIVIQFKGQKTPIVIPGSNVQSNQTLPCKPPGPLERLWAYLLVKNTGSLKDALMSSSCIGSNYESHEIDREELALKYNLVTNFTSMVITQDADISEIDGQSSVETTPSSDPYSGSSATGFDEYDESVWEMTSADKPINDEVWFYPQTFNRGQPVKFNETTSDTSIGFENNPKMATSFKIVGNSNWIFYSMKNFKGHSLIFKPGDYQEAERLGVLFRNVLSIKKIEFL